MCKCFCRAAAPPRERGPASGPKQELCECLFDHTSLRGLQAACAGAVALPPKPRHTGSYFLCRSDRCFVFVSKGSMCVCAMFWFLGLPACCAKIHLATHIKRASIKVHDFALQENAGALHATQDSGLSHGFLWGGCGVRQTVLPLCTFSTGHARKSPLPQAMDLYFSI